MRISDWSSDVCSSDLRNGYAVGGAHTPETPTLHRTSKALTLRMTGDVDQLPCDEMVSRKLSSDVQQRVISDTEFSNLQLGFNFRFGEVAALRLGDIFWFRGAGTGSESDIASIYERTACTDEAL